MVYSDVIVVIGFNCFVYCLQFESECHSLKKTVEELEAANSVLEQTCHELRQKLKISTLAVKELEESHDNSSGFEGEVQDLREQVQDLREQAKLKDNEMMALKEVRPEGVFLGLGLG